MIPIFPLPNVVLFPNVFLPLYIFEERYQVMVSDALKGDRIIGMVLLRGGESSAAVPAPPVYPVGCSGVITHSEALDDGCFNIVLRGLERFRIVEEDHSLSYRQATVEKIAEKPVVGDELLAYRERLEELLMHRQYF